MENFIVSARKYRPATFDMVVGQDSITGTLKNAIRNNYLAQAYLFCGPRGVGKTTCARIFAKTINCTNLGDNAEPCNECESCVSFNTLRSLNIHELDAASNNKVEDIRTLTDMVRIPPQIGKYSIYIIDEVHMLSSSAFNAFLKTLEEPPPHAVFILATTEKHKIIPTILSRCQIFDFNRIKTEDIVNRLKYVAGKENTLFEEEALHVIAVKADGALRDALSIFDQIISFSGGKITYKDVIENLNLLDYEYYFKIIEATLKGSYSDSLLIFDEILENGFDGHNFISGLGSHIRDLLVSRDEVTLKLLETAPSVRQKYREQSMKCTLGFLLKALELSSASELAYKNSKNQRLLVELTLFRLASLADSSIGSDEGEKKKVESSVVEDQHAAKSAKVVEEAAKPDESVVKQVSEPKLREMLPTGTKTLSVKDVINNGVGEPPAKPVENRVADDMVSDEKDQPEPMTEAGLKKVWSDFAKRIKGDSPRISGQLAENIPNEISENAVVATFSNNAIREEFDRKYKIAFTDYLRRRFDNSEIIIHSQVDQSETGDAQYYTDEQKFAYLSEKNPALKDLRRNFNLDFE